MPQNNKHIIAQRRARIAELHLKGYAQFKIAEIVGCTQSQVSRDLKILSQQWKESAISNVEEKKSRELAKLDMIENQLWEAWERSCDKKQRQKVKKIRENNNLREKELEMEAIQGIGDARYISEIIKCIQTRIKILGIEGAQKLNLSFEQMDDEQLTEIQTQLLNITSKFT